MGIPGFYNWLVEKYPLIVEDAAEEDYVEYDNLYLEMTGIIYQCLHPENRHSPVSSDEVFQGIFDYLDFIVRLVRPHKLVYIAIDGVAPRAKMNEQRSRRFRAAKDLANTTTEEEKLRREFEAQGKKLPPKNYTGIYYSNFIAPGTEFMASLSSALKYYIHLRLNHDIRWEGIKVILSDANVPGEGEQKIMSYIRVQRNLSGYDLNTRHCVYGSDADLIPLALATHEVYFSILRKAEFKEKRKQKTGEGGTRKEYQFLHVWRLRECLENEIRIPNPPIEIDFENIIDDFVLMCSFLGNDFLPRMPSLEIWEGAINLLVTVYKREIMALGDYLTDSSKPNLRSVERFIQAVGSHEDNIFRKRAWLDKRQREKAHIRKGDAPKVQHESLVPVAHFQGSKIGAESSFRKEICGNRNDLKSKLKELLREKSDTFSSDNYEEDKVKLGEPGWKERYYEEKFSTRTHEKLGEVRKDVVAKYIEGLCWVMHYYHKGVCSWKWFYPYHYAPFASDIKDLEKFNVSFELGSPFKPFTQMLGISPPTSSYILPKQYRKLINDPNSPIIDFYPMDFEVNMNGKRYSWQGIAKLPFIDETRLLAEVAKIEHTLTDEEVERNNVTHDLLFVSSAPEPGSWHKGSRTRHMENDIRRHKPTTAPEPVWWHNASRMSPMVMARQCHNPIAANQLPCNCSQLILYKQPVYCCPYGPCHWTPLIKVHVHQSILWEDL